MGTLNRRAFLARQAMVWTGLLWLPKAAGQLVTSRGVPRKPAGGGGSTPPVFVTEGGAADGGGSYASASFSITPSGSNRLILLAVQNYRSGTGGDPSSVVFNSSESFTKLDSCPFFDDGGRTSFWKLVNPTATTANIVVTFSGNEGEYAVAAAVFSGVHQTTPLGTASTDYDAAQTQSVVTPATDTTDLAVILSGYNGSATYTNDNGETTRSDHNASGYSGAHVSEKTAGTPTTTLKGGCDIVGYVQSYGVSIKPV